MTSCSRCVEKFGLQMKSIRNPSSVLIYLLVLLHVHHLQHLVEYLEHNVSVYQPLHPHGGLLLLELLQEGENQFGETQHTVLYCTVLYCTLLYCTVLYCTVLYYVSLIFSQTFTQDILRFPIFI